MNFLNSIGIFRNWEKGVEGYEGLLRENWGR